MSETSSQRKEKIQRPIDVAWRPAVPPGHTEYTWSKQKPTTATQLSAESLPMPQSTTPADRLPSASSVSASAPLPSAAPKLPILGRRNILITSALPYVNNVPHLGNIIGCVLSADVYARFARLRDYNAIYVCGTDEYGTATETKAIEMNMTPQAICDKYHAIHKQIYAWFNISFDYFGRTTTPQQTSIAQHIFNRCDENGYLVSDTLDQLFCEKDDRFLADRFVHGTCPICAYEDARGDQCDKCGNLLNAVELINPYCHICKTPPIKRTSKHLFLDLSRLQQDPLTPWIEKQQVHGAWTSNAVAVTKAWLEGGLKPRCITRDLRWGTPVPKAGYEGKVFYVWFDAPIGYISITANYTNEWKQWWYNPDNVQLYQFMGKDNTQFHSIIFPSSLMATKENWTLLYHINTTEYLNYESMKFSKSRGTGVFGDDAIDTNIDSDIWRYYMLINRPESADTIFLWEDFQAKNNSDLCNNVGNFVQRLLAFIASKYQSVVPEYKTNNTDDNKSNNNNNIFTDSDKLLFTECTTFIQQYIDEFEAVQIKSALVTAMKLSSRANKYLQDTAPWELYKKDKNRCAIVVNIAVNLCYYIALLLEPFMPVITTKLCKQLNYLILSGDLAGDKNIHIFTLNHIQPGHIIGTPTPLFRRIEDAEIIQHRERFGEKAENKIKIGAEFELNIIFTEIIQCDEHPEKTHLFIMKLNCGENQPNRTIIASLKPTYLSESLIGKRVPILINIKYPKIGGIISEGQLLIARKDRPSLIVIDEPSAVALGTRIVPGGCTLIDKDKIDPKIELKNRHAMETVAGGLVEFKGLKWSVDGHELKAENGVQGAYIQTA